MSALVGVAVGAGYTLLKYRALGDLAVFLDFGMLGGLGSFVVQTGSFSWLPVLWTMPMSMLVIAILHANNWRDIVSDGDRRVKTMASDLRRPGFAHLLRLPVFGSWGSSCSSPDRPGSSARPLPALPWTFSVVLLALPRALRSGAGPARRRAPRQPMDFIILDGATAQYNLIFGLLCTAAVWLRRS